MWTVFGVKQFISEDVALYGPAGLEQGQRRDLPRRREGRLRLMVGLSTYLKMGKVITTSGNHCGC